MSCLGKGGFGQVFDARRRSDNSPTILKILPKDQILNWEKSEGVGQSVNFFKTIRIFHSRNLFPMKSIFSGVFVVYPV